MGWPRVFLFRCSSLVRRRRLDERLDEELQAHIAFATEEMERRGHSKDEAKKAALREFGNVTRTKEDYRLQRGLPAMEMIMQDMRFAIRQLRKSPGFALISILTLVLGIAAAVAIFEFVNSALVRPLPYHDPTRLVQVFETTPQNPLTMFSHANYLDLRESMDSFSTLAAYDIRRSFVLATPTGAQQINGIAVTPDFFRTLGVVPFLGRDFDSISGTESLSSAPPVVLLSFAAWQKRFAGRQDVIGESVRLNGEMYTVIGVLPRNFQFAPTGATEFWTSLRAYALNPCELQRGCLVMNVIARLKPDVSVKEASNKVEMVARQLQNRYPVANRNIGGTIVPLSQVIVGDVRPILLALLGGAGMLLLIAFVNVGNLLLVRSEVRRREFAIRGALGAARGRLIRQVLTEGFVMVAVSSLLGVLGAVWSRHLLVGLIPSTMLEAMPYLQTPAWDWHVAVFAGVVTAVSCVVVATAPAWRLPLSHLREELSSGGRGNASSAWRKFGSKLVVLELATTMVLLTGAGLLGKSLYKLLHEDLGFIPAQLATLQLTAPASRYSSNEQTAALQREVLARIAALPGVSSVGVTSGLPVGWLEGTGIQIQGRTIPGNHNEVGKRLVSPGYFKALQGQLVSGRYFDETDSETAPHVAIINQSFARQYFSQDNPIGKAVFLDGATDRPIQIVGLIRDIKEGDLDTDMKPVLYAPSEQNADRSFSLVVRTSQDAGSILPVMVATIYKIDPEIATADIATMPEIIRESSSVYLHSISAWLVGGFAGLALVLSVIGLYGVIAYSVSNRTREIGVRMALGARRGDVYQLIFKEAGLITLSGVGIGLVGSIITSSAIRSLLFGVRSLDVATFVAVSGILVLSAFMASFLPARRAAAVNPVESLRSE